ncbi:MAG: magnesium transporter CorA family protein [Chloroflexi bacterium]|jgi:magnesium transporter|nr:magnesium transporter CorA family protein [Anaerolineaceae bacterium]NMB88848.1 magnesium transporter CorA family protein [Chloroflexota bacterium]
MITYLKSTENGLEQLETVTSGVWINVIDPTTDEIEELTHLGIPMDFITYPLDIDERPRTEREDDGTTLILIRIPYFQGTRVDVPFTTIPLGVVLAENFILTVCRRPNEIIQEFAGGKVRGLSTSKRNRFVLRVLLNTANKYLAYLREIDKTVDVLEDQLQASMRNKEVMELLKYQKSLVYFTTALKSNELVLERLQRGQLFHMYPDDEDLLEDVITENQQAIEMINISNNILSSMMDAFASIISNNLNVVMKFLASVTIVLNLPTIVTSFFGMNVGFPFQNQPWAYLAILAVAILLSTVVVVIFVKRDWF